MNLHPQDCSKFTSNIPKSLCQTLVTPVTTTRENPKAFTGLPATDILILAELSDRELIDTCAVNKYVNDICNNESFWLNRLLNKYGNRLGSGKEIREKYFSPGTTWKEYYLWLSNLEEDIVSLVNIQIMHNREDLRLLYGVNINDPILVSNPGYFMDMNMGPAIPANPASVPLNQILAVRQNGVTTLRLLAGIINIYEKLNGPNPQLRTDIRNMIIPTDQLTPAQIALLRDPETVTRMNQETQLVDLILNYQPNHQ